MLKIRPFVAGDEAHLDGLLDEQPDRLWRNQGHLLHGPNRDGDGWRRTLIAQNDARIAGAATLARNTVHPGRYNAAVEVAPYARRRGIAGALVAAARELRPAPLPLGGKVRESDVAGRGLLADMGGRAYQRCPCPVLDLDRAAVHQWRATQRGARTVEAFPDTGAITDPFAAMYRWLHERWSPVGDEGALRDVAAAVSADADLALSRIARGDEGAAAIALVFRDGRRAEIVAETLARDVAEGPGVLAAAIAGALGAATAAGVREVEFDGHDDDPHLAAVLAGMPVARTDPLLLVEVP